MTNNTTNIIDNNEIRIGTFAPDNVDAYAHRPDDGEWWVRSHGPTPGEHAITADSISEEVAGTQHDYEDLSPFADAMLRADELATQTPITRKQAEMYVMREELDWSRSTIADRWKVSESNVDELVRRAKKKIEEARNLVALIE